MPRFQKYIGVDYSGAKGPDGRLPGLRVFSAEPAGDAMKKYSDLANPTWNWTRRLLGDYLFNELTSTSHVIIGIDHAFSFPQSYFDRYRLSTWNLFLKDFVEHWPTSEKSVEELRHGNKRTGDRSEKRITEIRTPKAKSVFQLDGIGTVGKSTHTGLSYLEMYRRAFSEGVMFWPFDGFSMTEESSAIVEVYPALFHPSYSSETNGLTADERDAKSVALWLRDKDQANELDQYLNPELTEQEREIASHEGWILGVM